MSSGCLGPRCGPAPAESRRFSIFFYGATNKVLPTPGEWGAPGQAPGRGAGDRAPLVSGLGPHETRPSRVASSHVRTGPASMVPKALILVILTHGFPRAGCGGECAAGTLAPAPSQRRPRPTLSHRGRGHPTPAPEGLIRLRLGSSRDEFQGHRGAATLALR